MLFTFALYSLLLSATSSSQFLLPHSLNVTTITVTPTNESALQCWQILSLNSTDLPGIASSAIGNLPSVDPPPTYFIIPPGTDGGLHNAPVVQFVAFFSGSATFEFPNNSETAIVKGERNGLILAIDTKQTGSIGHIATYARNTLTNGVALPVKENHVPKHRVFYGGPCKGIELV